jgi:hypothetical protein
MQEIKTFSHLMVDIETMGTESFSSIISIGALEFDLETGNTGKAFCQNISLQSCVDIGLNIDADTVLWWLRKSEEARNGLNKDCINIAIVLLAFSDFCNKNYQVWGNSARFDFGILKNAYDKAKLPIPWDFKKERCVRTLVSFKPEIKENFNWKGVTHNALADCYNQVGYCSEIWASLKQKS